jgi:hypothetical protein
VPKHSVLELVFLMVILKIPIVYLCGVVYYAIKAGPKPEAGAGVTASFGPDNGPEYGRRRRPRRSGPRPHGGPARSYPRVPRTALARAERR